jgi:hypothetical protein
MATQAFLPLHSDDLARPALHWVRPLVFHGIAIICA